MGRTQQNRLTLRPRPTGGWLLTGMFLGKQIRRQGHSRAKLEGLKQQLEQQLVEHGEKRQELRHTWLTSEQLRDAEAAAQQAGDRSLLSCVIAAEGVLGTGEVVKCAVALQDWRTALTERKRREATLTKNRLRVEDFLAHSKAEWLHEITDRQIERWIWRKGVADFTRVTDASVLRAWLTWCTRRRLIGRSPFEVDMKDLLATARPMEGPQILTPEQCWALLAAAETHAGGKMAAYVILSTWCFMRPGEVMRTTRAQLKLEGSQPMVEVWPMKRGTPSYRTVNVPACMVGRLRKAGPVFYSRTMWETIRAKAGIITLSQPGRHKRRGINGGAWQADILRHTGISYLYQQTGDMKEVCRQAGNSSDVSFRHYLQLPAQGAAAAFYKMPGA